jgi:hypothetical protein
VDSAALYWFEQFAHRGLTSPQAHILATLPGLDRHAVREALDAARARGSLDRDADYIFDSFS